MSQSSTSETVGIALARVFRQLDACFELQHRESDIRPEYPGAWTIAEHLEHVTLANRFLLLTIGKGCEKARRRAAVQPIPEGESDLDLLSPIATPGAFDWPPPSHMMPTGARLITELRTVLKSQREICLQLLAGMSRGEGRLCSIRMSVHDLGPLDMYQWLYFLAQHASFHLALIARGDRSNGE